MGCIVLLAISLGLLTSGMPSKRRLEDAPSRGRGGFCLFNERWRGLVFGLHCTVGDLVGAAYLMYALEIVAIIVECIF
jgi:hypothetical protein